MKLDELVAKMAQIEEQASLMLAEYPQGLAKARVRLVMAIARQVRAHLLDQLEAGGRQAASNDPQGAVLKPAKVANSP